MKTIFRIALAAAVVATMAGCKAFRTLTDSRLKTAQGAPYELIVVCPQQEWTGEVGDTLRAIFTAPIPYLNQTEPLFDVLRVTERGFTGMVADHRNILKGTQRPHAHRVQRRRPVRRDVRAPDRDDAHGGPATSRSRRSSRPTAGISSSPSKTPNATAPSNTRRNSTKRAYTTPF